MSFNVLVGGNVLTPFSTDDLLDLSKYKPEPESGKVVGWATHKESNGKKAEFRVVVQSLKEKASKDEL